MKRNRFIEHINFYFKWDVLAIIIFILIVIFLYNFIPDDIESKNYVNDRSYIKEIVKKSYEKNSDFLNFNSTNVAILKMDVLYSTLADGYNSLLDPIYNDDFDQCAGYIIIEKSDSELDIDISHICDMIDY